MPASPEARTERKRGLKEARDQLPLVQKRWPQGFPVDAKRVRPLALGIVPIVAAEMGWNPIYTRGVLLVWKQRMAYCRAVLRYDRRCRLDGTISDEVVDDQARAMASETLARIVARRAKQTTKSQTSTPVASIAMAVEHKATLT